MKKILIMLTLFLLIPQSYSEPMPKTQNIRQIIQDLELSDYQKNEIIKILRNSKKRINNIKQEISKLKEENVKLLNTYPINKEQFLKNQEKISELYKEIHLIRATNLVNIISILDENQCKKFVKKIYPQHTLKTE